MSRDGPPKHLGFQTAGPPQWDIARGPRRRTAEQAPARKAGAEQDVVARFSAGEISRKQAMRALGINYGELLDKVSARRLPLPRVSEEAADRMASTIVDLLDTASQ